MLIKIWMLKIESNKLVSILRTVPCLSRRRCTTLELMTTFNICRIGMKIEMEELSIQPSNPNLWMNTHDNNIGMIDFQLALLYWTRFLIASSIIQTTMTFYFPDKKFQAENVKKKKEHRNNRALISSHYRWHILQAMTLLKVLKNSKTIEVAEWCKGHILKTEKA